VDECSRAVVALEKGMAFMQTNRKQEAKRQLEGVELALKSAIAAVRIETESSRKLKSFLQQSSSDGDDLSLHLAQPQAKMVAYESKSGGIIQTVKDMQAEAEAELSDLRKKEMTEAHQFKVLEQGLTSEITNNKEKLGLATSAKATATEAQSTAEGDLAETKKTKAADEEYSANLKTDCETAQSEWATRQQSAKEEMAAIDKAKEILTTGVTAFSQVSSSRRQISFDMDEDKETQVRKQLRHKFEQLGKKFHSFSLMQMASAASSDPFVKIRGLIEDMIEKLIKEAQEEASQKAFCDEEMGKSKTSEAEKTATLDKLTTRIDGATATVAELKEAVKTLEAEIAEIDKAQAEATEIRTKENADNTKAMKEFRESADAVIAAIGVLKSFYEGSLLQTSSRTTRKTADSRPEFGGAKSDTGSSIISVLEVAESDFTRLLAETETAEEQAADSYAKLSEENKVSKATKEADAKAKLSEIKSLEVSLSHHKEDKESVSAELDAVLAYLDKLKPQCEEKAMSYEERKAARDAEISGLKEALGILEGNVALVQSETKFLSVRRY